MKLSRDFPVVSKNGYPVLVEKSSYCQKTDVYFTWKTNLLSENGYLSFTGKTKLVSKNGYLFYLEN